jgi:3',5'-cyclic AMP phosphodiesterase CpdA
MTFTFGIITDLHFGPEARHEGKLRKLTHHAGDLTRAFVRCMNDEVRPDMIVNLGDDIEDEDREKDLARYGECQSILRTAKATLVNVAGNHDTIHMNREDLNRFWQRSGTLYYSFDSGDWHFTVLHTLEKKDVEIRVPTPQIEWLAEDLRQATKPVIVLMHHSASEQWLEDSRWFHGKSHLALVKERADIRRIFESSNKVKAVFNGHVHRNHLDVIGGIPYVTVQSLIENLDEDAPGTPAAAHAVVTLDPSRITVRVHGNDPARYQFELV